MNDINARIQTIIGGLVIENAALKLQIEQLQAQLAASKTTADPKPPPPAVVNNRVITRPGLGPLQAFGAAVVGAVGALGLSRLRRR